MRGSPYAWEMRLISADRLSTLLRIKEKSNEETTIRQIKELLRPFEYTKIDKIIDVIFAAAEDVEQQSLDDERAEKGATDELGGHEQFRTGREELDEKRQAAVDALSSKLGVSLLKHRQTLFWSSDKTIRVCAAVSKRYERNYQCYWYAYHPAWNEFLVEGTTSYFVLACMDRDEAYAIPHSLIEETLTNSTLQFVRMEENTGTSVYIFQNMMALSGIFPK